MAGFGSGVTVGAGIGSIIPGVGTVIGGTVGGIFDTIGSLFGGGGTDETQPPGDLQNRIAHATREAQIQGVSSFVDPNVVNAILFQPRGWQERLSQYYGQIKKAVAEQKNAGGGGLIPDFIPKQFAGISANTIIIIAIIAGFGFIAIKK